jgi:uncharacterized membrane protein
MSAPSSIGSDRPAPSRLNEAGAFSALFYAIRRRILSGLIAALPIALTLWIVYWLYTTIIEVVLYPAIRGVRYVLGSYGFPASVDRLLSPPIAVALVLFLLYALGLFVRSRVHEAIDWVLLHLPVVNTIFKAINNVFQSIGQQLQGEQGMKRVVLVPFPNHSMRSLAFVTNSLRDEATGRTILCVCVLTGVMPPAGFTLFIPEEDATDLDWPMNVTLQAIMSGGITVPETIRYVPRSIPPP